MEELRLEVARAEAIVRQEEGLELEEDGGEFGSMEKSIRWELSQSWRTPVLGRRSSGGSRQWRLGDAYDWGLFLFHSSTEPSMFDLAVVKAVIFRKTQG